MEVFFWVPLFYYFLVKPVNCHGRCVFRGIELIPILSLGCGQWHSVEVGVVIPVVCLYRVCFTGHYYCTGIAVLL